MCKGVGVCNARKLEFVFVCVCMCLLDATRIPGNRGLQREESRSHVRRFPQELLSVYEGHRG